MKVSKGYDTYTVTGVSILSLTRHMKGQPSRKTNVCMVKYKEELHGDLSDYRWLAQPFFLYCGLSFCPLILQVMRTCIFRYYALGYSTN